MGVTPRQKELVQTTWERVVPISEMAAGLFYGRLFEVDPELRALFHAGEGAMKEQGRKLMQMITIAVNGLDRLDRITPAVQDLGRRHVADGVHDSNYEPSARRSRGRWSEVSATTSRRRREERGPKPTASSRKS